MVRFPLLLNFLGTQELILVILVILFMFGPKKIPELARSLGKGLRKINDAKNSITDEIKKGMNEVQGEGDGIVKDINEVKNDMQDIKKKIEQEVKNTIPRK
ncbi:MAG: twin-arginine translocase TatA/TatE family subunit [Flavobacteriales bacterium]|jgi:TatA/E family protein of Tat protein translocase|nr:twin-arginine translocase TatA/TatE family subunit [Flavobacteriales bacterium]